MTVGDVVAADVAGAWLTATNDAGRPLHVDLPPTGAECLINGLGAKVVPWSLLIFRFWGMGGVVLGLLAVGGVVPERVGPVRWSLAGLAR